MGITMITKNAKTILFASLIAAMILPFSTVDFVDADKANIKDNAIKAIEKEAKKDSKKLKQADKEKLDKKIRSDNKAAQLLEGKNVVFVDESYHGNLLELQANPDKPLDIIMHYEVNGQPFTVVIDGETNEILGMRLYEESEPLLPNNGIVAAYPQSGNPDIDGLRMDLETPDWTYSFGYGWNALLLNGMKDDQTWGLCTPSEFPDAYFAQVGLVFDSVGADFAWADTQTSCNPQKLMIDVYTSQSGDPDPADAGDDLLFQITIDDSSDTWVMYAYNITTDDFWYKSKVVSGSNLLQIATPNTGIFYENPRPAGTGWSAGFAADPVVDNAYERRDSNGGWYNWSTEGYHPFNCDPGDLSIGDYLSGTTTTGLTFDVSDIDDDCGI